MSQEAAKAKQRLQEMVSKTPAPGSIDSLAKAKAFKAAHAAAAKFLQSGRSSLGEINQHISQLSQYQRT